MIRQEIGHSQDNVRTARHSDNPRGPSLTNTSATMRRLAAIAAIWFALAHAAGAVGDAPAAGEKLLPVLRAIQAEALADFYRAKTARAKIEAAGVELGTWRRIGPFRDQPGVRELLERRRSAGKQGGGSEPATPRTRPGNN